MVDDLARCDREIAEASKQMDAPAWLVTLGVEDWEAEKRLLRGELRRSGTSCSDLATVARYPGASR